MSDDRELDLSTKMWLKLGLGPQREAGAIHRLSRPLADARLAVVTTGGFFVPGDKPFKTGKFGDPTYREIPRETDLTGLRIRHPHYDHRLPREDINVLFPLPLLERFAAEGRLGELAPTHYSFMGYVPLTRTLENKIAPQLARRLQQEEVDAGLLVPA